MSEGQIEGRRVVITGMGVMSPLGIGVDTFWENLSQGNSGIAKVEGLSHSALPGNVAGEVKDFTETAARKQYLKKQRKSIKVMCREIQLGVASAGLALDHSAIDLEQIDHQRFGIAFGANLMLSPPSVLGPASLVCGGPGESFNYDRWGTEGLAAMEPLWLLKYLPNMPACHIGIFADARGPNNSLTLAEASGNLAIGEAFRIIGRGDAEMMIAGTTGTRVHPVKSTHTALWDTLADSPDNPAHRCRPFDQNRKGQVAAEGACSFLLEEEEHAKARGATIYASVLGGGSSCVISREGKPNLRQALVNSMRSALNDAGMTAGDIGHINANGWGDLEGDIAEAQAILEVFGDVARTVPVTGLKSYFGNSGAGCGTLELAGSICGLRHGVILPTLNFETVDPECPINVVHGEAVQALNKTVLNLNVTRVGQSSALIAQVA